MSLLCLESNGHNNLFLPHKTDVVEFSDEKVAKERQTGTEVDTVNDTVSF